MILVSGWLVSEGLAPSMGALRERHAFCRPSDVRHRPGEVLVSADVVETADRNGMRFEEIGPVTLRGVVGAVRLYLAVA